LAATDHLATRVGAMLLLAGVTVGGAYVVHMLRGARA